MVMLKFRKAQPILVDHLLLLLSLIPIIFLLTYAVSMRDYSVGTDTENYSSIFYKILSGTDVRYEPGFVLLVRSVGQVISSDRFFFGVVFLMVLYGYFRFFRTAVYKSDLNVWYGYLLLLGFLFVSSWFLVSTTNSIRQGMALPFLYVSIISCLNSKYFSAILYFIVSVSFHFSTLLIIPFLFLLFFSLNFLALIYFVLSFFYVSGISELLVKYFSDLFGLPLYSFVKNNVATLERFYGFSLDQYIYTNFWFFLGYALVVFRFLEIGKRNLFKKVISVYGVLCLPYFSLGFGGVSNRYAMLAWAFVPLLQVFILLSLPCTKNLKSGLSFFAFLVGSFFYFLKTQGIFY